MPSEPASAPVQQAPARLSASTPGRTSARWATRARSSPVTPRPRPVCARCASTGRRRSTSTPARAGRHASTRSRRSCCRASYRSSTAGTRSDGVAARFYGEALAGVGDLVLPPTPAESAPVWHLYVIRTADPESLALFLRERGIGTGRHYPDPVHLTAAYARSVTAPATSLSRRRWRANAYRCRSSPASRRCSSR